MVARLTRQSCDGAGRLADRAEAASSLPARLVRMGVASGVGRGALPYLEGRAGLDEPDGGAAVIGPGQNGHRRELRLHLSDNALGLVGIVHADQNRACAAGACRVEDVEAGAVAEIDLKPKLPAASIISTSLSMMETS